MKVTATTKYEQMGIAALLPGMTYAIELVQRELDDMRARLNVLMNGGAAVKRAGGRPKGQGNHTNSYWANMTAEERSAEIKRRNEVRYGRAKPKQAAPSKNEKLGEVQRRSWANYTPAQRKKRIAAAAAGMRAARAAKAKRMNGVAA